MPAARPDLRNRIDALGPSLAGKPAAESVAQHTALVKDLGRFV